MLVRYRSSLCILTRKLLLELGVSKVDRYLKDCSAQKIAFVFIKNEHCL